ncbi:MAG TPA: transporter, partial [Burkholderiaceae bacterium]|nr:transporter [Burkholderiaceae bacterium]
MSIERSVIVALALGAAWLPRANALDLLQAWQGALQHAPDVAVADAARQAGAARAQQAKALWRPSVVLEGGVAVANSESSIRGAQFAAPGFGQT